MGASSTADARGEHPRRGERSTGTWRSRRLPRTPTILVALLAAAFAVLRLRVALGEWELVGDEAVIALRAGDVFGANSPLIGMPSGFSAWSGAADPFHPGPTVFWVMAPFVLLLGANTSAVLTATWLVATASAAAIVTWTDRLLGRTQAVWAAAWTAALAVLTLHSWRPVNPVLVVLPSLAVLFLTWAVAAGRGAAWPLLVAFGSLALQADLAYLPSTLVPLLGAVAVTVVRWRGAAKRGGAPPMSRMQVGASVLVALVLWSLPIADTIVNGGGNVAELLRAAGADVEVLGLADGIASGVSAVLIAAGCAAVAVLAWRTRSGTLRALGLAALLGTVGALAGQAGTPAAAGIQPLYRHPFVVSNVFLAFAVTTLAVEALSRTVELDDLLRWPRRIAVGSLALYLGVAAVTAPSTATWMAETFDSLEPLTRQIDDAVPDGTYQLRSLAGPKGIGLAHALTPRLEDRGIGVTVDRALAKYLGAGRLSDGAEQGTLYVTFGSEHPPTEGSELVARWVSDERNLLDPDGIRRRTAEQLRAHGAASFHGSSYWIGSVVAGTGIDGRHVEGLDDDGLAQTGQRFLEDDESLPSLSDRALTKLVGQGLVAAPEPAVQDASLLERAPMISVWLDDELPHEAEPRREPS